MNMKEPNANANPEAAEKCINVGCLNDRDWSYDGVLQSICFACSNPARRLRFEKLAEPASEPPTHRCKICGALWRLNAADPVNFPPPHPFANGSWTLVSISCGKCCDNVEMGTQIEPLASEPVECPACGCRTTHKGMGFYPAMGSFSDGCENCRECRGVLRDRALQKIAACRMIGDRDIEIRNLKLACAAKDKVLGQAGDRMRLLEQQLASHRPVITPENRQDVMTLLLDVEPRTTIGKAAELADRIIAVLNGPVSPEYTAAHAALDEAIIFMRENFTGIDVFSADAQDGGEHVLRMIYDPIVKAAQARGGK